MELAHLAIWALLPLFATCRVLLPHLITNTTSLRPFNRHLVESKPFPVLVAADTPTPASTPETLWQKHVCRGEKLHNACRANKDEAARFVTPIDSPFDSTLEQELARWGYRERNDAAAASCWLDLHLPHELAALNIDPRGSDEGGPNECFMFLHYDLSLKINGRSIPVEEQTYVVDGKTYRVRITFTPYSASSLLTLQATKAHATIGANSQDGIIYFFNVKSAVEGAKLAWEENE